MPPTSVDPNPVVTNIPERLDRLPLSSWHLKMVLALGITWLLDGLEVTLTGSLAGILKDPRAMGFSDLQVGATATAYLAGAVAGALFFGWLTDLWGRRKLFFITLGLYLSATAATALSWNFGSFIIFRGLTGAGIGGEYAAINSAIDELIPAPVRGKVDLGVNATFWIGAALGSLGTLFLLNSSRLSPAVGWRCAFGIGALLGLIVLVFRRHVPESPRWLMLRGRETEAEAIVRQIEHIVESEEGPLPAPPAGTLTLHPRDHTPLSAVWKTLMRDYPRRTFLGLALMVAQAFFYNAVFFTYGLVLIRYFGVRSERVPIYLLPLALSNFAGPLVLGHLFDSVGRRRMIAGTYGIAGLLLAGCAWLFLQNRLTGIQMAGGLTLVFFIASAAASSAYLTVSEVFPLEVRAFAISIFYAVGTLTGGVGAPLLFARLIAIGSRSALFSGYMLGAGLMLIAATVEGFFGVNAERRSLEAITPPLEAR